MAPSSSRRRVLFALAGASLLPLAVACNGIIGLSDYTRAECSGGEVCDDAGGVDTGPGDAPFDTDRPDAKPDAAGTLPVSWAAWPMPNYDAGGALDNPMGYDVITNQGFQDRVTKLVWRHPMPEGAESLPYESALKVCESPWRLPSRIELVTLLDLSASGAKANAVFKTPPGQAIQQGVHWTFSEVRPFDVEKREHWVVDFDRGGLAKRAESQRAAVRCVRGGGS
ncbi:MAG: DUF1566 domain-containing protein [Labilithrix sp.]|nr:DUF1566 domain-containing protein [Labilithrix sp.]